MAIFTIDRIEGNKAVLLLRDDERQEKDVPLSRLPMGVKQGDMVQKTENGFILLEEETKAARQKAQDLLDKLKKRH
ncbi:DUF3006 domain-containing protein [Virgibacillus sediminis]|uniref:DUF3006 domain-containing protein n=1 Tax=Virgibacillus sediminis TaxID=202260 RepID=A0ABV7A444_9BACI